MKKEKILEINKKYSEKFIQPMKNPKVPKEIKNIIKNNNVKSMIDLGCGDGILIHAIKKEFPKVKVSGVDLSPRRIAGLRDKFSKYNFYCVDATNTKIKEKFDFVHSSQVIEHVPSDKQMVCEMHRLLKSGGILFCSSVIKKRGSIYKYRCDGKFALDPTHVREYSNQKEFLDLFKADFKLIKSEVTPVYRTLFGLSIRIPGFYLVGGIWKKRK